MRRFIPLIVIVLLVGLLAAVYGPGVISAARFRGNCQSMLKDAAEGRLAGVVAVVEPSQQQEVQAMLSRYLPADYYQNITELRLIKIDRINADTMVAIVKCQVEHGAYAGIYQGRLSWRYHSGQWWWDFLKSSGAEFSLTGEPAWVALPEIMPLAEGL